jgi:DNA-binding MarR family transcriptional regulator
LTSLIEKDNIKFVSIANYIQMQKSSPMPRPSFPHQNPTINNPEAYVNTPALSRQRTAGQGRGTRSTTLVLADRLHSAAIHLLRRVRKQDAATGEGPARLSALSVLVFGGPKTPGELAAAEQVKPPTMSRIVAGLARSRLVEVTPDAHDARRLRIRATPKGTRLLQKGRRLRISYLAAHLDSLTPAELAKLGEAVEILRRALAAW